VVIYFATSNGAGVPVWTYLLVAAVLIASFGVTVVGIREPRELADRGDHHRRRLALRVYVEALVEQRQAMHYLGTLFVYQFGLSAILPYLVLFIVQDIHQTDQVGFALSAVLLVVTAIGAVVFGALADRVGTRRVLTIGWALLAISALAGVVVTTLSET